MSDNRMIYELSNASLNFSRECIRIADKYGKDRVEILERAASVHFDMVTDEGVDICKLVLTGKIEERGTENE